MKKHTIELFDNQATVVLHALGLYLEILVTEGLVNRQGEPYEPPTNVEKTIRDIKAQINTNENVTCNIHH